MAEIFLFSNAVYITDCLLLTFRMIACLPFSVTTVPSVYSTTEFNRSFSICFLLSSESVEKEAQKLYTVPDDNQLKEL